ncbi:MAG: hypothetical protein KAQ98_01340 [Bacteriovoracaceae bacterium]|nr:hypothetical protein [Bacteriovoracaceae bacterium]
MENILEYSLHIYFFFPIAIMLLFGIWGNVLGGMVHVATSLTHLFITGLIIFLHKGHALKSVDLTIASFPDLNPGQLVLDGDGPIFIIMISLILLIVSLPRWDMDKRGERLFKVLTYFIVWILCGAVLANNMMGFLMFSEMLILPLAILMVVFCDKNLRNKILLYVVFLAIGTLLSVTSITYLTMVSTGELGVSSLGPEVLKNLITSNKVGSYSSAIIFICLCMSMFIKMTVFPFHFPLLQLCKRMPTFCNILILSSLPLVAVVGMIKLIVPAFTNEMAGASMSIAIVGVLGCLYCTLCALRWNDIKEVVIYFIFGHLSLLMVSIFLYESNTVGGTYIVIFNHLIHVAGMLYVVHVLQDRMKKITFESYGNMKARMPLFNRLFFILIILCLGPPMSSGFISRYMVTIDAVRMNLVVGLFVAACFAICPIYLLRYFQMIMLVKNKITVDDASINDVSAREGFILIMLIILVLTVGIYPNIIAGILG